MSQAFTQAFPDIPYAAQAVRDPFREFDLYISHDLRSDPERRTARPPLICFVHGGAWRAEDKFDHGALARNLAACTGFAVAVPNYRLTQTGSTEFFHPGHAEDVLQFLTFLMTWDGPQDLSRAYDERRLYLMGHSCGAHMLTSIFLDSSSTSPSLCPTLPLLCAVQAVIVSEGIYDIDLLLSRFPTYREWFIEPAFRPLQSYIEFSTTNFPLRSSHIRWLVIHSKGDTLVDRPQSESMYKHLCKVYDGAAGTHIAKNMDELDGEHNGVLRESQFVHIVTSFILDDFSVPETPTVIVM